jgi:hypothetical protein
MEDLSDLENMRPENLTLLQEFLELSKNSERKMDTFSLRKAFYTRDLENHANKHDAMRHISDQ